jgi:hypothetical protein
MNWSDEELIERARNGEILGYGRKQIEALLRALDALKMLEQERYRGWAKWFRDQPKIETTTGTQSVDGTINLDLHMIADEATETRGKTE